MTATPTDTVPIMEAATYLAHLRRDVAAILATPPEALSVPVTACPGWTVTDLLEHHAGVFRFATAQLRAEPGSDLVPFDPPGEATSPLDLFSFSADELLAELVAVDPDEHRPNWAGAPTARFWFRRMTVETAIHRFDVESTHTDPAAIDAALAVDGVDEFAEVFLGSAKRRGITGSGETVHLHATDEPGEWMFTFTAEGVDVTREHGKGDMAARGPASDLLLLVWNRRPVDVQAFGEPDLLSWWADRVRI